MLSIVSPEEETQPPPYNQTYIVCCEQHTLYVHRGWTNSCNFGRIYCYFSSQPETNIWFEIGMIWSPHHSKILNICYKTWSYSNNFSIFEIILIFALWFSSISNSNSKVLNRIVNQVTRAACSQQESGILFGKNSGFLANTSSIWFQR